MDVTRTQRLRISWYDLGSHHGEITKITWRKVINIWPCDLGPISPREYILYAGILFSILEYYSLSCFTNWNTRVFCSVQSIQHLWDTIHGILEYYSVLTSALLFSQLIAKNSASKTILVFVEYFCSSWWECSFEPVSTIEFRVETLCRYLPTFIWRNHRRIQGGGTGPCPPKGSESTVSTSPSPQTEC